MAYSAVAYRQNRGARNDASRNRAHGFGQPWTQYEDELIMEFWVLSTARDEVDVAEAVGRTVEACRFRAHVLRCRLARERQIDEMRH